MTRDQAIKIAQEEARLLPESYVVDPFQPHEWVINAILYAYRQGYIRAVSESLLIAGIKVS